jgi:hypothetical protein
MERSIVTFVERSELNLYKKCIKSQQEWAEFHGVEHRVIIYEAGKKDNRDWEFYCNYIDYVNAQESGTFIGILPSVMILNKHTNPFDFDVKESFYVNDANHPSVFILKKPTDSTIILELENSKKFKETPHSFPMLGIFVLSCKVNNFIFELPETRAGYPYIQGLSSGMEMHLDTNKDGEVLVSYNPAKLDDSRFYQPGDFAVNLNLYDKNLTKGYITEFLKVKDQIKRIMKIGKSLENDLNNE